MIELESISKKFESQVVLDNINATFDNGKSNLIIGLSGAGKTVLLKCIVGLLTPDEGKVLYDGRNMITLNQKERLLLRREMGMLFQSAALFDSMSVLENVMFPLDMFSEEFEAAKRKVVHTCAFARRYAERYRVLCPEEKDKWGPILYKIYLELNLGKEFEEICKLYQ